MYQQKRILEYCLIFGLTQAFFAKKIQHIQMPEIKISNLMRKMVYYVCTRYDS